MALHNKTQGENVFRYSFIYVQPYFSKYSGSEVNPEHLTFERGTYNV